MRKINYVGRTFGILTVLAQTDKRKYKKPSIIYLCKCKCGKVVEVAAAEFSSRRSCGCLRQARKQNFGDSRKGVSPTNKLAEGQASFNSLHQRYKKLAKKRNLSFELDESMFKMLISQNCHYCGSIPKMICKSSTKASPFTYNGIDRQDNSVGYVTTNVVTCCKICNRAKDILTVEEFSSWVVNVSAYWAQRVVKANVPKL